MQITITLLENQRKYEDRPKYYLSVDDLKRIRFNMTLSKLVEKQQWNCVSFGKSNGELYIIFGNKKQLESSDFNIAMNKIVTLSSNVYDLFAEYKHYELTFIENKENIPTAQLDWFV